MQDTNHLQSKQFRVSYITACAKMGLRSSNALKFYRERGGRIANSEWQRLWHGITRGPEVFGTAGIGKRG